MPAFLAAHAAMFRAWAIVIAISLVYVVLGGVAAHYLELSWWWGLVPAAVMLVFGEIIVLAVGDHPLGGRECVELTRDTDPRLHEVLDRLCALSGQPRPELRLLDLDSANAFTHVDREGRAEIYLSADLVTELDTPELEAVLAHEMAHIAHRDERMLNFVLGMTRWPLYLPMAIIPFMCWFDDKFVEIADRYGRVLEPLIAEDDREPRWEDEPRNRDELLHRVRTQPVLWALKSVRMVVIVVSSLILLPLLLAGAVLVILGLPGAFLFNQQRELAADRAAAQLTGAPSTLAAALDRLQSHHDRIPAKDLRAKSVSALAIIPIDGKGGGWFSTHPPLSRRMDRLGDQARNLDRQRSRPARQ
ncbi:M48 family metalloprotease [Nocardiopsis exhalans]|uniref:M48 family metalloprotease n=1 Tax=Nocardiopsis exhalans TaxID=163604 RepID=A0ABY5D637_9ACTN|nr:M48 family metalloprotease [Nocardiopsis exhalans]USY19425.1 M48 family metalloprotease [Nocardiopsis exhalans]